MTERRSQRLNPQAQATASIGEHRDRILQQKQQQQLQNQGEIDESIQRDEIDLQNPANDFEATPTQTNSIEAYSQTQVNELPSYLDQQIQSEAQKEDLNFDDIFNDNGILDRDATRTISYRVCSQAENIDIHRRLQPLSVQQCRFQLGIREDSNEALIANQLCAISEKLIASVKLIGSCPASINLIDANEDIKTIAAALAIPFSNRRAFMTKFGEDSNQFDPRIMKEVASSRQHQQQTSKRRPMRAFSSRTNQTFMPVNRRQSFRPSNFQSSQSYQSNPTNQST
jgi:hypothetical protein